MMKVPVFSDNSTSFMLVSCEVFFLKLKGINIMQEDTQDVETLSGVQVDSKNLHSLRV